MHFQPHWNAVPHVHVIGIGRYALYDRIASGGMATVHLGRLLGPAGFARTVAIKRLHPQYAQDPDFVSMFGDEARLATRIRHPNVVRTLDVAATSGELFLVMEYVHGESLARLVGVSRAKRELIPPNFVTTIMAAVLHGLHAAHEARDERGEPLGIVHRDVSPQNVLVGTDGIARVLDFGVAMAAGRGHTTRAGQLKGKLQYMAPEQISGKVARTTDVYAASVVLWEALTGRQLFSGDNDACVMKQVLEGRAVPPSRYVPAVPSALDTIILRGLDRDPRNRFPTASEMALALEDCVPAVPASQVGEWVQAAARGGLTERSRRIAMIESDSAMAPHVKPSPQMRASGAARNVSPLAPPPSSGDDADTVRDASAVTSVVHDEVTLATQLAIGSISAQTNAPASARPRSPRALASAAALGCLLAGALVTVTTQRRSSVQEADRATAARSVASEEPLAASPPSRAGAAITEPGDALGPPQLSVTSPAPPTTGWAGVQSIPRAAPRPHAVRPAGPPKPACDPPFYFNAQGNRVFKKECL